MTVGELIEVLKTYEPDRLVVLSSDSEGNSHSPLASHWSGKYEADSTWSGDVGLEKLTVADIEAGYTDEDIMRGGVQALILGPVN